jgi:two-component system cell cycle sensor histidine kinase/response regulator CckA
MTPKSIKVLLVEDDLGDALWIQEILEAAERSFLKFELHHCSRLAEALEYCAAETPDAVLLDLGLPDSHGMTTLKSLVDVAPDLPVVVLTGLADEEFGAAAVQQGAQDYLIKGQFNQDQLVRSLRYALERKQAEEALRRSEASLAEAQRITHLGNFEWDFPQEELFWSDEIYRIFGLAPQELCLTYQTFLSFIHPDDLLRVKHRVEEGLKSGKYGPYDYRIVRRDGSIRSLCAQGEISFDPAGRPRRMVGAVMDITARHEAEMERVRLSKLESLAILAGGIAHDLNNLLLVILGNISLATAASSVSETHERLAAAETASGQAKGLAQQLLTFAKGGAPIKKRQGLKEIIQEALKLALSGSHARAELSLPDQLWDVEVDRGQIHQVFNNLLINADQAMPTGGQIRVQAENLAMEGGNGLPLTPGKYVAVTLTDQGTGIPPEHLEKIFDPYFTTKQKGSGLGLATVHSIVTQHGGYITVDSHLGRGTAFNLYLPALEGANRVKQATEPRPLEGQGRILVMDDDATVREVLGKMLSKLGYESVLAQAGEEALELFTRGQTSGEPFAAVILDLTIPGGMGGIETVQHLIAQDPKVKAVVSSGYADNSAMADFKDYGFRGVIAKPYRLAELGKILHEVLNP